MVLLVVIVLQARVLAARDHSGAVPLVEGRTAAGSLIIACGTFLPEGVHQMVDIQPGGCCLLNNHHTATNPSDQLQLLHLCWTLWFQPATPLLHKQPVE